MIDAILCSNCFMDQGLRLDSSRIGVQENSPCRNCGSLNGTKLDRKLVEELAYRFFDFGSLYRPAYGAFPLLIFNEHQYQKGHMEFPPWLQNDVKLIEEALKIGFIHYGPRAWMFGDIEPLNELQDAAKRPEVIGRILKEYPSRLLAEATPFYRLRKNPAHPSQPEEYDSPPYDHLGKGRLESATCSILYGSQDLEVCIHECRTTVEDEMYVATLVPVKDLKLLDLTELLEEDTTEFESLDHAVQMLFLAGAHSYEISRAIATSAYQGGFDGLIYPSYFSLLRTGARPFDTIYGISIRRIPELNELVRSQVIGNLAIFGKPIEEGKVMVRCINRLQLSRVGYDVCFGPVLDGCFGE